MISLFHQLSRPLLIVFFFFGLSFLTYHKSLTNEFMLDDHAVLLAKEPGFNQIGKSLDHKDESHVFFRPVTNLFRGVLISTLPKDPVKYHWVNIVLFALHLGLVFFVLKRLLRQWLAPLVASVLYGVHPVNAAFINYITGHEILLFGIFLDVSALLFVRYSEDLKDVRFLYASVIFFVLALFTQEISIVFLFFVFLTAFQLLKNVPSRQAFRICLPYSAAALFYLLWRFIAVSHTTSFIHRMFQYGDRMSIDALTYVNTVFELIAWYIGQLFGASQLILVKTLAPQFFGLEWKIATVALLSVTLYYGFREKYKGSRVLFSILWFLTGFIPLFALALIYPYGGFVIEPHWFFFSSLGFFLFLGLVIAKVLMNSERAAIRVVTGVLIAFVIGFWYGKTQAYNQLFRTQESYCRYWLTMSPDFYFPNFWLARDLVKQNKLAEAEYHFKKSFIGNKNDWLVFAGLGDIEAIRDNFLKTREYYLEAFKLNPGSAFLKKNLEWLDQMMCSDNSSKDYEPADR